MHAFVGDPDITVKGTNRTGSREREREQIVREGEKTGERREGSLPRHVSTRTGSGHELPHTGERSDPNLITKDVRV